jgi:hypothetical protein
MVMICFTMLLQKLLGRHEESDAMPVFTQEAELGCIEWEA